MSGYHVRTGGEVAELRDSSVEEVDVLEKADCCNLTYESYQMWRFQVKIDLKVIT